MLGLFGSLNLGARSLQTQQQGVEIAGHNLANVNNPAYARQRLAIATATAVDSEIGPEGTGVGSVAIVRLRSNVIDQEITSETSVSGSLDAQQQALQQAQTDLGQIIDTRASGTEGAAAAQGAGGQHGIAEGLNDLFNEFQSLSTDPSSLVERQVLLMKASDLATRFNQVDQRLGTLSSSLDDSLKAGVTQVNSLLQEIAKLNDRITGAELSSNGVANDLRDTRQAKIEELAKLVKITTANGNAGAVNISVGGTTLVDGNQVSDTLETYDAGGGQLLVRAATAGTPLTLSGGNLQGTIDVRDGAVAGLKSSVNALATQLITQVNAIHAAGYGLGGGTGAKFFNGSDASDISVNSALLDNPALLQAAGVPGATGDNQAVLALAQLASQGQPALNNQTFSQNFNQTVAALGQSLSSVNDQIDDQQKISNMLQQQRDSVSGVSLDEEMTDMVKFQKAFQASAKLITTVDELLDTVVNMKR